MKKKAETVQNVLRITCIILLVTFSIKRDMSDIWNTWRHCIQKTCRRQHRYWNDWKKVRDAGCVIMQNV